ncbi:MAG: hypothetical protein H7233_10970 [Pseudorhodobacter sp.]|nr:hypothetical protein [Frankiaceae bacterium]
MTAELVADEVIQLQGGLVALVFLREAHRPVLVTEPCGVCGMTSRTPGTAGLCWECSR